MIKLDGISISAGIASGELYVLSAAFEEPKNEPAESTEAEKTRVDGAIETAKEQLGELYEKAHATAGEETAAIFEVQAMMLEDDDLLDYIHDMITQKSARAEYAVYEAGIHFSSVFAVMDDSYMKERAVDISDLATRLINILRGRSDETLSQLKNPVIVAAEDIMPSQTIQMDKSRVLAFVLKKGSMTSHAAILARSLGIPAVASLGDGFDKLESGSFAIADGSAGCVVVEPTDDVKAEYDAKTVKLSAEKHRLQALKGTQAKTKDGNVISLYANIGHPDEVPNILVNDAEGIGLFRSEFLYLDNEDFPSEETQFEAYKSVLCGMGGRRVVIRTLDLGADKQAPYFNLEHEENPALGYRAIRICLDRTDIFVTQLRALLRSSVYGKLAVMFPMIVGAEEVKAIYKIIDKVKADLKSEGRAFSDEIEFGIMIETPASVIVADKLAELVDFFSVGTNDLTQYTYAADRLNQNVSYLFDSGGQAIIRMIKRAADEIHKKNKWIGICGESAADVSLLPYYLAMGIDELSMSAGSILQVKDAVLGLSSAECVEKLKRFLD